jgi:kynureninase
MGIRVIMSNERILNGLIRPLHPYFMSHSAGPRPAHLNECLQSRFLSPWDDRGGEAWGGWLEEIDGFLSKLAALMATKASQIAPKPSVTNALLSFLGALASQTSRRVILVAPDTFPSLIYAIGEARHLGFTTKFLAENCDPRDPESWAAHADDQTAAFLIMHVHSNTGLSPNPKILAKTASNLGVQTIIDVAQSIGILSVMPEIWGVDCVIGSSIKWLSGGPGSGFLWLKAKGINELTPQDCGWFSHLRPFEFAPKVFEPADQAKRFWGSTPSPISAICASAGLDIVLTHGQEKLLTHNRALIRHFFNRLPQFEYELNGHGGTLCLDLGPEAMAIHAELTHQNIMCDRRANRLRLSFGISNDEGDIEALVSALKDYRPVSQS